MLTHLRVKDFTLIESLDVALERGLTVITGETGAGKSVIVNALLLAVGERASADTIRSGIEQAEVQALFEISPARQPEVSELLEAHGVEPDHPLVVRRILSRAGRNKVFVNGCVTRVSTLKQATRHLVEVSGQHEQVRLQDTGTQRELLDAYGGLEEEVRALAAQVAELIALEKLRTDLEEQVQEREAREDYLRFQLQELTAAQLDPEEEAALEEEVEMLRHAEALDHLCVEGYRELYERQGAACEVVSGLTRRLSPYASLNAELKTAFELCQEAAIELEEAARALRSCRRLLVSSPERLAFLEDRLALYSRLQRKYRRTVAELCAYQRELKAELDTLETSELKLLDVREQLEEATRLALAQAVDLTLARQQAALKLASAVEAELAELGMPGARFRVEVEPQEGDDAVRARGLDRVVFGIAPNPGEPLKPLARTASGGELSRTLLALKSVLSRRDPTETYVFDEIDSGLGGRQASVVGRKLKDLARHRQILCITHQPQIAALADCHLKVKKRKQGGRTVSTLETLDAGARIEELARMLGGTAITRTSRAHAAELLERAVSMSVAE